ncbi:putative Mitochondrial carrier protein [Leishmania shawi]|uniref:Mitochondrial carrier protein n=1 Tax=Leishmania shawi TaxID=5680 RepID=A0AAW3CAW5_9TRYP
MHTHANSNEYPQPEPSKRKASMSAGFEVHNRNIGSNGSEANGHGDRADEPGLASLLMAGVGGSSTTAADVTNTTATTSLLPPGSTSGVVTSSHVSPTLSSRERVCFQGFLSTAAAAVLTGILLTTYIWRSTSASNIDPATGTVRLHSFQYFVYCFLGGMTVGMVHLVVAPIDILKCRVQVGEYRSFMDGFIHLYRVEAGGSILRALPLLFRGWLPMLWGYGIQGSVKFSLYEFLKYKLLISSVQAPGAAAKGVASSPALSLAAHSSSLYQFFIFLFSSCLAEVVADLGLAPWEAVKIRMQTSPSFPMHLRTALPHMWAREGLHGFYKGLVPLWCRQVPYTMIKFSSFEFIVAWLQSLFNRLGIMDAAAPGVTEKLVVSLLAGVLAGLLCGVVSHPADTVLSRMNQRASALTLNPTPLVANPIVDAPCSSIGQARAPCTAFRSAVHGALELMRTVGWRGMWKGLAPRLLMVVSLTALQWVTYDGFKVWAGLPTTGDVKE